MVKDSTQGKAKREPVIILRRMDSEHLAVRFEQIGSQQRFRMMLQRFKGEFLLATYQVLDGLSWWIVTIEQIGEVKEFGRRNGMKIIEE